MGKKPKKSGNISLPPGSDPPSDENVIVPRQVKHAAAVAEALATGQPVPSKPKSEAGQGFPHSEADIDQALQRLQSGALQISDPAFDIIRSLAEEGARQIKARRRGAGEPRKKSDFVTRRQEALIQAYRELSRKRQKTPTGAITVEALRQSVIQKLGLEDKDEAISEDTIKNDVQQLSPLFRLVREGIIPHSGKPSPQSSISEKTRLEMEAGAKAVARAGKSRPRSQVGKQRKAK